VIDSLATAFLRAGEAPGISIAVLRGRDTILIRAWGSESVESGTNMTPASVIEYASITKQFVSVAVLQLAAEGRVRLESPIEQYVNDLPTAWRGATVEQYLNHTAGVPNFVVSDTAWERHFAEPMTPRQILSQVATAPMKFEAGAGWEYKGTGYVVLGLLIEAVTGRPWEIDLQQRFLDPLGLSSVKYCRLSTIIPHRASGYERVSGRWQNMRPLEVSQRYTAGALCGTAVDVTRWNVALHSGRLLPDSLYRRMITPAGAARAAGYGYGIYSTAIGGLQVLSHGGVNHGFSTGTYWVPAAGLSVTVLSNGGFAHTGALGQQIVRAALGQPLAAADR
jgi:CubicO group peptidase (beta-lactamase class C family)